MASKFTKPYTEENTNFARIARIVVELCRDILWDFLSSKIKPSDLPAEVVQKLHKLVKLHDDMKAKFKDYIARNVFPTSTDMDFTALYCLIRNLLPRSKLTPPSKGWGATPDPHQTKVADDVERLRGYRNMLYGHIKLAAIPNADYQKYVTDIKAVFKRFDSRLGTNYDKVLNNYSSCVMDPVTVDEYKDLLMKQIEYDEQTRSMVEELRNFTNELNESVNTMKDDVENAKGGMEQLKCAHDDAVERIHEMEERQSEAKELYVGIQKKVDKQTDRLEQLGVTHGETVNRVKDVEDGQRENREVIEEVKMQFDSQRENQKNLKQDVRSLENNLKKVKNDQKTSSGMANININVNPTLHVHADQVAHGALEKTDECADVKESQTPSHIPKTYSQVVRSPQKREHKEERHTKVTHEINVNVSQRPSSDLSPAPTKTQYDVLKRAVNGFRDGHFVLVCAEVERQKYIESIALVPWTVVFDLDPNSRTLGLLSVVEEKVSTSRSLYMHSLFDKTTNFTESSTHWYSVRSHIACDAPISQDFANWNKNLDVSQGLKAVINNMKSFSDVYTRFRILIFWPPDESATRYMERILAKLEKHFEPKMVVIDSSHVKSQYSSFVLTHFMNDLGERLSLVQLPMEDLCNYICQSLSTEKNNQERKFVLPVSHVAPDFQIDQRQASWLREILEVLYEDKQYDCSSITAKDLLKELDNFYRGGTLPWFVRYEHRGDNVDTERELMRSIIKQIKEWKNVYRSGIIRINHAPGSGGTTIAQRILWECRQMLPCAQVNLREGYMINEVEQRLELLYKKTDLPLLVLLDGEDEHRVDELARSLEHISLIVLTVNRYPYRMTKTGYSEGEYWLDSYVSRRESNMIAVKLGQHCDAKKKKENIQKLNENVKEGNKVAIFEFGLAAYAHEYTGIRSYVSGFLRLDQTKGEMTPWQMALTMLSFTYYYGQIGMPCQFFTDSLHLGNHRVPNIHDFPEEMQSLIVPETNDRKQNMIRISHYFIAKEILEQVLPWPKSRSSHRGQQLCIEDKRDLEKLATAFIKQAEKVDRKKYSHPIMTMLTKTFISRDSKLVNEKDSKKGKKKNLLSPLLSDLDNNAPFTSRFKVFSQLTKSFPKEARFHAQLGRLYTILKPEMEAEAEKHFKKALELCKDKIANRALEDLPRSMRLTLMMTNHMYGRMFHSRVEKFTGKNAADKPTVSTPKTNFFTVANRLLEDVKSACVHFGLCRYYNPEKYEDIKAYDGEICVRLQFCEFVSRNSHSKNAVTFIEDNERSQMHLEICEFLKDCMQEIDSLFLDYFSSLSDPDDIDPIFRTYQSWYTALFKKSSPGYITKPEDSMQSRRLYIAQLKIETGDSAEYGDLLRIKNPGEISSVIKSFENNFEDFHKKGHRCSKSDIDRDYREWLVAIRHKMIPNPKSVEDVLQVVEHWYKTLNTPWSRLYLFILKSILGFGSTESPGNTRLLLEAKDLKAQLWSQAKYIQNARRPREWFGKGESIRCLELGSRYSGKKDRSINSIDLALFKGTINYPNKNPRSGSILIDLGPGNSVEVKAFFVPLRAEMEGPSFAGRRVEFSIGFSFLNGYEAFFIKQLKKVKCPKCGLDNEATSRDTEIQCRLPCGNSFSIE